VTRDLFQRGDRIAEYEILGRLRAGGMATLFLGRRHGAAGVSRQVVIKVIHPHLAEDEQIVKMFIDEARISSHISHGNVVYVEKFGEHDGIYYMVMEYVDGTSLDQVLRGMWQRRERLTPAIAAHIAIEVAAGLHAAHETCGEDGAPLHIVHRDVSPSNVLLTRDGRIKVIDFGIAKARGRLGATKSGHSLKGKIRYMSPEQAWGHEIDRRTDVYALGVVLWELLACKQLFREDDDFRLLELVRNPTVPPVGAINPLVSVALEEVIAHAMAKDPADRIATASELRRELKRAVPEAAAVPTEDIGKLVEQTRATLGIQPVELEFKATTPALGADAETQPSPPVVTPPIVDLGPGLEPDSLVRGNGELQPGRTRRSRWTIVGAAAGAIAIAAVAIVVMTRGGDDPAMRTPATLPASAPPKPSEPAPAPVDAGVAVAIDAAPPEPAIDAKPATVARPRPARPANPAKPDVRGVEVDGVLLADPNAPAKPQPRPTPKPKSTAIDVDGTPLAP
jgi:serine/threonine-protein kinase